MKMRVTFEIDSSNYGCIIRLQEDGVVSKVISTSVEDVMPDREKAVIKMKEYRNGHSVSAARVKTSSDLRAVELVVAIMQSDPDSVWHIEEIGARLHSGFGHHPTTASSTMSILKKHGYVNHVSVGNWKLSELGCKHEQNVPLPFKVSS